MLKWMTLLNRQACEVFSQFTVHACTDITGFGLLGHVCEMAEGSKKVIHIYEDQIPFLPKTEEMAAMGILPSGVYQNQEYLKSKVRFSSTVSQWKRDALMDPQTSGGLLAAIPAEEKDACLKAMAEKGCFARVVGKITGELDTVLTEVR